MTKFSHLNALIQKNAKIMKRKCSNTLCEIFFPIILMLLVVLLRKAFKIDEYYYSQTNDNDFIVLNSSAMTSQIYYHGLSKRETFSICRGNRLDLSFSVDFVIIFNFPESILIRLPACLHGKTNGSTFYRKRIAEFGFLGFPLQTSYKNVR